ncbi:MAG: class I SAM-dependent methyltransferase [Bacteroidales bacterium]|nr:class I SAM-dependent methyltransferase [Bacteroidales bacterium]
MEKITLQLGDVETTALIPVAIKANETLRENPRIKDDVAVNIIKHLDLDTKKFDKFMSHEGVIARTVMLDRMVKDFVAKNPNCVIVNLGAGFDNRFSRVDNGSISWFDIDFDDLIAARKKVFEERERVAMIASDILKEDWVKPVKDAVESKNAPALFIAEGLFMYLSFEEIGKLFNIMKNNFEHGVLFAEQNSPMMVKGQKHHDTIKSTNAVVKSGTKNAKELEHLCPGIRVTAEHSFNEEMKKHSIRGKLFAFFLPSMNDRWATFEW